MWQCKFSFFCTYDYYFQNHYNNINSLYFPTDINNFTEQAKKIIINIVKLTNIYGYYEKQ